MLETIKYDVSIRCNCLPEPTRETNHSQYLESFMAAAKWAAANMHTGQCAVISAVCLTCLETLWEREVATFILTPDKGMVRFS